MLKNVAENMTWHALFQSPPGVLLHPVDGKTWQNLNGTHVSFKNEVRNVTLGLRTNGFTPFKQV